MSNNFSFFYPGLMEFMEFFEDFIERIFTYKINVILIKLNECIL